MKKTVFPYSLICTAASTCLTLAGNPYSWMEPAYVCILLWRTTKYLLPGKIVKLNPSEAVHGCKDLCWMLKLQPRHVDASSVLYLRICTPCLQPGCHKQHRHERWCSVSVHPRFLYGPSKELPLLSSTPAFGLTQRAGSAAAQTEWFCDDGAAKKTLPVGEEDDVVSDHERCV